MHQALLDAETAALCEGPDAAREVADAGVPDHAWPPAKRARVDGSSSGSGAADPATPGPLQALGGTFPTAAASAARQQRQTGEVEDMCDLTEDDLGPHWVTQSPAAQAAVAT